MTRYITKEEFGNLIRNLPNTKRLDISVEDELGGIYDYRFAYVDFNGGTYLYSGGYLDVGVIQDTMIYTFDECLDMVWEQMIGEDGENKPYIKDELNTKSPYRLREKKTENLEWGDK